MRRPLTRKQKTKLFRTVVIDYIRSKPTGTIISIAELGMAGGVTDKKKSYHLIHTLEQKGYISNMRSPHTRMGSWTVLGDVRTVTPKQVDFLEKVEKPKDTTLIAKAKEYYWLTHDDSLHAFVEWLGYEAN